MNIRTDCAKCSVKEWRFIVIIILILLHPEALYKEF